MADLIIQPNAGAGNQLIIKDQAGNAVLTTDDSGATINAGLSLVAGMIIKNTTHISTAAITADSSVGEEVLETDANDITVTCTAGNKLHIHIAGGHCYSSVSGFYFGAGMTIKESGQSDVIVHGGGCYARGDGGSYDNDFQPSIIYTHTAVTTSVTIKAATRTTSLPVGGAAYWEASDSAGRGPRRYFIQEEQV
tara:strand:- start:58 stop:639 length:582 start_codon:yes stop_codon:yes gene_type:complete